MYTGVPFHYVKKRGLGESETAILELSCERLRRARSALRNVHTPKEQPTLELSLSDDERRLWSEVLASCLAECGESLNDLAIHLTIQDRDEATGLVTKLRVPGGDRVTKRREESPGT